MWLETVTNLSFEEFHQKIRDKRLVIIYPKATYHNLYLAYFMQNSIQNLHYYRLRTNENTIQLALSGLMNEWEFFQGRVDLQASIENIAQSFAKALASLAKPALIYLDELDHLEISSDYEIFFTQLLENLPQDCQVVINSRKLSTKPWQHLIAAGHAVVLGNEARNNDRIFSLNHADKPHLEINGFGQGRAFINGIEIDQWDGVLPRNLFFYFVDKPLVTRDEIFSIFWPTLNIKEATNVYHVTKRKITEKLNLSLNQNGEYELTNYNGGFYHPSNDITRHYDVSQFESDVEEASMTFDDAAQAKLYRRAIDLYKAPFLTSLDLPWVQERREKLQRLFLEALIGLARIHKSQQQHPEALGYFIRALRENPFREDLHREVMQLYLKMNYPQEALAQYQILTELLQDSLGVAPAPESQALYKQIKA